MNEPGNDRFDAFVKDAARNYNPPRATPRDEMWLAVVAGRRRRSAEVAKRHRSLRWVTAAAAVLVIGIALGRLSVPVRSTGVALNGNSAVAAPAATYRAVAGQHFDRVETLLTMFTMEAGKGRRDAQMSDAARSLLTTNRLLLDSPVGNEPRLRQLLEDLDLVLAQIAQLSAEKGIDPTGIIVRALEDNGVLLRLRSAVPAGAATSAQGAL